jgi:hypothetical protein
MVAYSRLCPFRLSLLAGALVFISSLSLSAGGLVCARAHTSFQFQGIYKIVKDETLTQSELVLTEKDFDPKSPDTLFLILQMIANSNALLREIDKGTITLAFEAKDGARLQVTYKRDDSAMRESDDDKGVYEIKKIEKIGTLRNPKVNQPVALTSTPLEDLQDGKVLTIPDFPEGLKIGLAIPTEFSGPMLQELLKISEKIEWLSKKELAQFAAAQDMAKIKSIALKRSARAFALERILKSGTSELLVKTPLFALLVFFGTNGTVSPVHTNPETSPTTVNWVMNSELALASRMGAQGASEMKRLNEMLQQNLHTNLSPSQMAVDPSRQIRLDDTQAVWVMTVPSTQRSYLVFSKDKDASSVEYVSLEIDPKQFPQLTGMLQVEKLNP